MPPDDAIRVRHMIEAAEAAAAFTSGRTRVDLDNDRQLAFALARAVEIFGEAAAKVSAETRAALQDIPWRLAIGIRNRLVHAYFDVAFDVLWATAIKEIPSVVPLLRAALADEPGGLT